MKLEQMVEKFQCPGCVCGSDTKCGRYTPDSYGLRCTRHVLGTLLVLIGHIALGLPKGFCCPGFETSGNRNTRNTIDIRMWVVGTKPGWDRFNVPVWAMVVDGFLFIRTYQPRLNSTFVDVVEGGTLAMVPQALNVSEFIDEID